MIQTHMDNHGRPRCGAPLAERNMIRNLTTTNGHVTCCNCREAMRADRALRAELGNRALERVR